MEKPTYKVVEAVLSRLCCAGAARGELAAVEDESERFVGRDGECARWKGDVLCSFSGILDESHHARVLVIEFARLVQSSERILAVVAKHSSKKPN